MQEQTEPQGAAFPKRFDSPGRCGMKKNMVKNITDMRRYWQRFRGVFVTEAGRPSRLAWWLTGCVLGYLLLFGLILPFALRGVLESQLSAALNTQATVSALRCNPLTLTVTARGIEIPYPEGAVPENSGPFLTLDELEITPSFLSYFRLAPGIKSLRLVNPSVDVTLSKKGGLSPHLFFPESPDGAAEPETGPKPVFPFLIYGLELHGGKIIFRDAIRETTHTVSDINLDVPFASTLKADRGVAVTPSLNATLNGRPLTFSGEALPFAETLRTEFTLHSGDMDLDHFRAYLAPYTPLALKSGSVHTELTLGLERAPEKPMRVSLSGKLGLDKLDLAAPDGARAFALEKGRLEVESALLAPLHLVVKECSLEKPYLAVRRKADGSLDWQGFITLPKEEAPPRRAAAPAAPAVTGNATASAVPARTANATAGPSANATLAAAKAEKDTPPRIEVHAVRLTDGAIVWRDDTLPGGFTHSVENIRVELTNLDTQGAGSVLFDLALNAAKQSGTVAFSGHAALTPLAVNATLKIGAVPLSIAAPYVAQALPLNLEGGTLESDSALTLTQTKEGGLRAALVKGDVALAGLAVTQGANKTPLLNLGRIGVAETVADTGTRTVTLGKIDIAKAAVNLTRQADGELLLPVASGGADSAPATAQAAPQISQPATKKSASPAKAAPPRRGTAKGKGKVPPRQSGRARAQAPARQAPPKVQTQAQAPAKAAPARTAQAAQSAGPAWKVDLGTLKVSGSSLTFHDQGLKKPAQLALTDIACEVKGFSTESGKPLSLDLSFKPGRGGTLGLKAEGTLAPLSLRWNTRFTKADLSFLSPYFGEFSTLTLAEASLNGTVDGTTAIARPGAAPELSAQGSISLDNLELRDGKSEFASLGRFSLQSLRYASSPKNNGTVSLERLSVEKPRISLAMQQNGTLSLVRIFPALQAKEAAKEPGKESAPAQTPPAPPPAPAPDAASAPVAHTVAGGLERITLGEVSLTDGRFVFRDQSFAKPSVVSLSEIALNAKSLSSDADARSDFTLAAKLNGSALNVKGKMNPLIQPPALESSVSLKDFNLSSVSAYAEKFIDYPISKGQFSLDVDINLADKQVDARNRLLFTQLTLGDKLNAPGAPNLPVKAAISLLSDLNGDVNLNIPISGSMDDPQFRTGALVGKVFATIMLKTVTSPFSLVTGILGGTMNLLSGGGGPDLDVIAFRPGSGTLNSQAKTSLSGLAAALKRRPGLKVTLVGHADGSERAAAIDAMVRRKMQEEKYADLPKEERTKTKVEDVRVSRQEDADEYNKLLAKVYVDFPFVRMAGAEARNQAPQEMLRRIHENIKTTDDDLRELAENRAKAVRDALLATDPALDKQLTLGKPAVTLETPPGGKATTYVKLEMK